MKKNKASITQNQGSVSFNLQNQFHRTDQVIRSVESMKEATFFTGTWAWDSPY